MNKNLSSKQSRQLVVYHASESLPALLREINFVPRRVTVRRKRVRVLGFEYSKDVILFEE